ncbi:MAG: AhpC/TSA family protein [Chitinophagales bacterium]|nr:AhpC/TSA family protein [Chitinophagales bacterium]
MKRYLVLFTLVFVTFSCKPNKDAFVIQGELADGGTQAIYLIHPEETGGKVDTISMKNGKFRIKGTTTLANVYELAFGEQYPPLEIILEPGKFDVKGSLSDFYNIKVTGGTLQTEYNEFIDKMIPFNDAYTVLYKEFLNAKSDTSGLAQEKQERLYDEMDSIKSVYYEAAYQFVESKPVNIVSAKIIDEVLMSKPDLDRLQPIVNKFDDPIIKSSFGQRIGNTLSVMLKTPIGKEAPLFTMNDVNGNEVSLESMRGKYVLIDFWASWCRPCRDENPRMVSLYNKFKSKKFDMLGVSIDQNQIKWKQAIIDDHLAWTQVIDEKSVSSTEYGVLAIPSNILLDPKGNIVGKNLFGSELERKLEEVLNL